MIRRSILQCFYATILSAFIIGCGKDKVLDEKLISTLSSKGDDVDFKKFRGINITPRGMNDRGEKNLLNIGIRTEDGKSFTIPVFGEYTDSLEAINAPYNIYEVANLYGVDSVNALSFIKSYSTNLVADYEKLEIYSVSSALDLGEFIQFFVTPDDVAVLLLDKEKVYHSYWVDFFERKKEIEKGWYYRQIKK